MALEPVYKIEPRLDGPTMVVGGYVMHPGDRPVRQGRMNAMQAINVTNDGGGKKIMLIGFGLGYVAAPLSALSEDIEVSVWDCMPIAKQERHDRYRLVSERCKVHHVEEEVEAILEEGTYVIPHPTAADLFYWELQFCETLFHRLEPRAVKAVSQRSVDFLHRLPQLGLVQEHYESCKGRTCVLVSPGPSMSLEAIKKLADAGYPIICCAQALGQLNAAGITPTITVCLDPQETIYEALKKGENPGWVYADAMSDPRIWDEYRDKCFAFTVSTAHCHSAIWHELGYDWLDMSAVTVSELLLEIAWKLGFSFVVTSGIDYFCPARTDRFKIECREGWTDPHYYAGSKAWQYMLRRFQMPWMDARRFVPDGLVCDQQKLELPAPTTHVQVALVEHHLRQMLGQQPEEIQKAVLAKLPPQIRDSFKPIPGTVGIAVNQS